MRPNEYETTHHDAALVEEEMTDAGKASTGKERANVMCVDVEIDGYLAKHYPMKRFIVAALKQIIDDPRLDDADGLKLNVRYRDY